MLFSACARRIELIKALEAQQEELLKSPDDFKFFGIDDLNGEISFQRYLIAQYETLSAKITSELLQHPEEN